MKGFLEYKSGNSVFHRMNPLTKLVLSIVLCAMCFISSNIFFVIPPIFQLQALHLLLGLFQSLIHLLKQVNLTLLFLKFQPSLSYEKKMYLKNH